MRLTGALQIVRFNWPLYVLGVLALVVGALMLARFPGWWSPLLTAGLVLAGAWLVLSLVVSHWVYDRSALTTGGWLEDAPAQPQNVAIFHAGHDEASAHTRDRFPHAQVDVYDFFDDRATREASLRRARALAPALAMPVAYSALPIADERVDLALIVFALHEVRERDARRAFVSEVRRILRPGGRLLVVEHTCDFWNALAYGPGALHFLTAQAFRTAFADGGLALTSERFFTPFVRCYRLEKASQSMNPGVEVA